jgi:hypothetical protein
MPKFYLAVLIAVLSAQASVRSNSEHYSDAVIFHDMIESAGYAPTVGIFDDSFVAVFDKTHSSSDDDKVFAVFLAGGLVSSLTDWTSNVAVCVFRDYSFTMSTSNCRTLLSGVSSSGWSDASAYDYIGSHCTVDVGSDSF